MTALVTRSSKGSSLSWDELDANFANLAADALTKAPLDSPVLTGNPQAPTPDAADHSTLLATTAFVNAAIQSVVGAAPAALATLDKIATQLSSDESAAAALTKAVSDETARAKAAEALAAPQAITYTKSQVDTAIASATPSFATLTGKPTTLSGYGITDALTAANVNAIVAVESSRAQAAEALATDAAFVYFMG